MIRWSLWADIEGFSHLHQTRKSVKALKLLCHLMEILYQIGTKKFSDENNRLFIYQFGDGFLVSPNPGYTNLEVPLSIAILIMQLILKEGGVAKTSISQGDLADITSCYPEEFIGSKDGVIALGEEGGLMTFNPVMGTALINSYSLSESEKCKGPLLLIDKKYYNTSENGIEVQILQETDEYYSINWIYSTIPIVSEIANELSVQLPSSNELINLLSNYLESNSNLPNGWQENARELIGGRCQVLNLEIADRP